MTEQAIPLLAEVSDKEPSITALWCIAAFFSFAVFTLCRRHRAGGLFIAPLALIWAGAVISEVRDPYVGPALCEEFGQGYEVQAYVTVIVPLIFMAIGLSPRRRDAA